MRHLAASLFALALVALPMTALAGDRPGGGGGGRISNTRPSSPVPEPMAMGAFAAGAVVVGLAIRRQRRRD